jgi:superfamily II DNA or RNA helicase
LLCNPTGSGKTDLMAYITRSYRQRDGRALWIEPRKSLINQSVDRLGIYGLDQDVGVIQASQPRTDYSKPIQVATAQTLDRRGIDRIPKASVVLVDEAHEMHGIVGELINHPDWQGVPIIGFSATPGTKGLGTWYDDLVVGSTTQELIDAGFLSDFKVFAPPSGDFPDLKGVKVHYSATSGAVDYSEKELAQRMLVPKLVADAVTTWQIMANTMPTLVYGVDRLHAQALLAKYSEAGVVADYIDAYTPIVERERIALANQYGKIEVVVNIGCLTTGIDWPWVKCIQLCRPTKSEMLYAQIVGRGLRTYEGKTQCLILDHTKTTENLGLVSDLTWGPLHDGKKREASPPKEEEAKPKECPKCHHIKPPRTPICPNCGHEAKPVSKVQTLKGELVEFKGKKKVPMADKQAWWSGLLQHAYTHGYARGWAAHKYRDKFGVWPKGLHDIPMEPTLEMQSWITSRNIAYAKRRAVA